MVNEPERASDFSHEFDDQIPVTLKGAPNGV
jgi:hypothetical protein